MRPCVENNHQAVFVTGWIMAAIPSMRKSIDVQVPDRTTTSLTEGARSIVLEIDAQDAYSINQSFVPPGELSVRLREIYDALGNKDAALTAELESDPAGTGSLSAPTDPLVAARPQSTTYVSP